MDIKFINDLLYEVNSLELVSEPSFLSEKVEGEIEVGCIINDETKKLFYSFAKMNEDKIKNAKESLEKCAKFSYYIEYNKKTKEILDEINNLLERRFLLFIFLRRNVEREIPLVRDYNYFRITRGWRVCVSSDKNVEKDLIDERDELFTRFDKYKRNANLN